MTESQGPSNLPPMRLRWVAAVLWLIGIQPTALVVIVLLEKGLPADANPRDPMLWLGGRFAIAVVCVLPLIAFGLLGLAVWRRSWRLGVAGTALVVLSAVVYAYTVFA